MPGYPATTPKTTPITKWRKVGKVEKSGFPDPCKTSTPILQTGKFEKLHDNLLARISGYNSETHRQHKVEESREKLRKVVSPILARLFTSISWARMGEPVHTPPVQEFSDKPMPRQQKFRAARKHTKTPSNFNCLYFPELFWNFQASKPVPKNIPACEF